MNATQTRQLTMYQIMRDFNTNNTAALAAIPGWTAAITAFNTNTGIIETKHVIESGTTRGATGDKRTRKTTLVNLLVPAKDTLVAFATNTSNLTLLAAVNVQLNLTTADNIVAAKAITIKDAITANLVALATYPTPPTAATATAINTALLAFNDYLNRPAETEDIIKAAGQAIKEAIKANGALMADKLKPFVKAIKTSNASLYTAFTDASKIEKAPSTPLALRGKVSSAATGLPLISTVRVDELEQQVSSTAFGNYQFASLPAGHYNITIVSPGYQDLHTTANIVAGKGTQLNVILLVDAA